MKQDQMVVKMSRDLKTAIRIAAEEEEQTMAAWVRQQVAKAINRKFEGEQVTEAKQTRETVEEFVNPQTKLGRIVLKVLTGQTIDREEARQVVRFADEAMGREDIEMSAMESHRMFGPKGLYEEESK